MGELVLRLIMTVQQHRSTLPDLIALQMVLVELVGLVGVVGHVALLQLLVVVVAPGLIVDLEVQLWQP